MLSVKKLIYKMLQNKVSIGRANPTSGSVTLTANERSFVRIDNAVPAGSLVIGINVNQTPNLDWVRTMPYMDGTTLVIRYHNEYSGSLTGTFGALVSYATVGDGSQ